MKYAPWYVLLAIIATYIGLVLSFGFNDYIALTIHFSRTALVLAVLIIFFPSGLHVFAAEPHRNRDYLIAGIVLTELSNTSFSIWNEMHRVFGVDSNIFTSPIAAFFSLLLALGAAALLKSSDVADGVKWIYAVAIAAVFATILVFVAPLFR